MTDLFAQLQAEHTLIDAMVGSLRTYVHRRVQKGVGPRDARGFLDFFRIYAGQFHHGREETVLFEALAQRAGVPVDVGPLFVLAAEHGESAATLQALAAPLAAGRVTLEHASELQTLSARYARGLYHHMDAEDSVLFPEGKDRLRRSGIALVGRGPSPEQETVRLAAQALVARYPPLHDPEVFRGEGCVMCPSYGVRCDGIERAWWTDEDWEELEERSKHME